MSGLKKGTITVECGPGMKNSFFRRLPFSEGLHIEIGEEDDTIQIQYELDNQGIETLVNFLNRQDKKEFWMTSHSQDDQHKDYDQDLARDISKILAYDDDGDDIIHPSQGKGDLQAQNLGSIGKPLDDGKKNSGPSNAKGLKSKSSSFYPPTDPRSNLQDDQYGRGGGPIGTNSMPKQPANHLLVPASNSVQYRVDDFDQLFQSDDEAGGAYYPRGQMGMGGQGMVNPNMSRVANPNMNPNLNPNMRGQPNLPMGHHGMAPGQMGPGGNQMYPPQNMPAGPVRKNQGPMPGGMGMNPNFPQQKPAAGQRMPPGGIQGQDMGFYGNFEDPQAKGQKGMRSGNKGAVAGQRGYNDYGGYAEDDLQGYGNMDYGRAAPGPMAGAYPPQHGGRMGNAPQGTYGQYKDEYQDPRAGFAEPMGPGLRNQPTAGAGVRPGMGAGGRGAQMANRYPVEEEGYYEEDYNEMDMPAQMANPPMGQHRGMGYEQGYDEYGNPTTGQSYGRNQGNMRGEYNPQYDGLPPQPQAVPQPHMAMGSLVQEPFTVEGSINSQTFDRKPGFDRNRKKVHTRERLRASLQKNKQTDQKSLKKKPDSKNNQGADEGDRMNEKQGGSPEGKDHKRDQIDSDNEEEGNNSRGYLEEEISSESNPKENSQGSLEDHADMMNSEEGMRDK
jgi:hypothetical protein